jgi:nitronate monooxygenase
MRTLQDFLGIELAIIQAPMAGVQDSALAIAVSNSGGLGSLPCAMLSAEQMRTELAALKAGTKRPFNANFFCRTPPVPNAEREAIWRKTLEPYYRELGLDQHSLVAAPQRASFTTEAADILEDFRPPVVSFHFGLPSPDLLARLQSWGAKILSSATTVEEALWLEAHGVDAIIAQGVEAGGHRGHFLSDDLTRQLGTFALLPQIVQAVNVPVIAAGGIADARGVAAARSLGAAGVQPGTAYLLCPEATTSRGAPCRVDERCCASHRLNEPVQRPSCARHHEPLDARPWPAEQSRAGVSTCRCRAGAASSKSRARRARRLLPALGGPERQHLPRDWSRRADARSCGRIYIARLIATQR